jgi:hypothetical protein
MKRIALIIFILLMALLPLQAQDAESTPEPDQTVQVTVTSGEAVSSDGSIVLTIGEIVLGVIAVFATGGVVGIGGAGYLAHRLRNDPEKIAALERLGNSVQPETAKQIVDLAAGFNKSVNELTLLVTETLDRIPASSKPTL